MDPVEVTLSGTGDHVRQSALIRGETMAAHRLYRLTLELGSGQQLVAEAADNFEAMRQIRLQLEQLGLLLCCAGARRDTWSSGMQRDMGQGLVCYILSWPRRRERLVQLSIFAPADASLVGTVAEQESHQDAWSRSPIAVEGED